MNTSTSVNVHQCRDPSAEGLSSVGGCHLTEEGMSSRTSIY